MTRAASIAAAAAGAALLLASSPRVALRFGRRAQAVVTTLRNDRLNRVDARYLKRGYYEDLSHVDQFNGALWAAYLERPAEWGRNDVLRPTGDVRGHELIPSVHGTFKGARFTTNSFGLRDLEYARTPAPGTFRVALLGSSYEMGSGVADGEDYESQLEARLNHAPLDARFARWEILDFGVGGYGPVEEYTVLSAKDVFSFRPAALYFMAHNDEIDTVVDHLVADVQRATPTTWPEVARAIADSGARADLPEAELRARLEPAARPLLAWVYRRIVEECRAHGVEPLWILTPMLPEREPPYRLEGEAAESVELARDAGFEVMTVIDVYDDEDVRSLWVRPWDRHPNAEGHRLIADHLYRALAARTR